MMHHYNSTNNKKDHIYNYIVKMDQDIIIVKNHIYCNIFILNGLFYTSYAL
jgi:hypothetical protein